MAHMQDPILLRAPRVYMYIQELKRVPFPNHLSPTKFYSLSLYRLQRAVVLHSRHLGVHHRTVAAHPLLAQQRPVLGVGHLRVEASPAPAQPVALPRDVDAQRAHLFRRATTILVNLGASLPVGARGALGLTLESRRLMVTRFVREFRVA